ncbi:MAG: AraC family transcriptional regulator [Tannerellaceae bacterium]|nr:AraC family transcriptional regulator [Tannerellaceae bacterium]
MSQIKYIVENERDLQWGLSICSVGFNDFKPYTPYPQKVHPSGYFFSPEKGRTLQEYQLIYISEGQGIFQTQSGGDFMVKGGSMFLLFPDEWHTYKPDETTGWKEYWIGFKGVNIDQRVKTGFLQKDKPFFQVGSNEEIIRMYQQAIEVAKREDAFFQQMLAGITNYLLGLMYNLDKNYQFNQDSESVAAINHARILMRENIENNITVQEIANRTNMSYSLFRKLFKEYTGFSPAQYFQEIRIQRAKELLQTTTIPVKEIAYRLHFETPGYFSYRFKQKTGKNPGAFRDQ